MPRKQVDFESQPKKKRPATLDEWEGGKEPMVRTTLDIPRSLHRRMKSALGSRGLSVRKYLLEYIERDFPTE